MSDEELQKLFSCPTEIQKLIDSSREARVVLDPFEQEIYRGMHALTEQMENNNISPISFTNGMAALHNQLHAHRGNNKSPAE